MSRVDLYQRSETFISDEPERLEESLDIQPAKSALGFVASGPPGHLLHTPLWGTPFRKQCKPLACRNPSLQPG